jgi:hypothetical protein
MIEPVGLCGGTFCAGDEAGNRQHQEHQHAGKPVADQPEVKQGNGQQQADDDVHGRASHKQNTRLAYSAAAVG